MLRRPSATLRQPDSLTAVMAAGVAMRAGIAMQVGKNNEFKIADKTSNMLRYSIDNFFYYLANN